MLKYFEIVKPSREEILKLDEVTLKRILIKSLAIFYLIFFSFTIFMNFLLTANFQYQSDSSKLFIILTSILIFFIMSFLVQSFFFANYRVYLRLIKENKHEIYINDIKFTILNILIVPIIISIFSIFISIVLWNFVPNFFL